MAKRIHLKDSDEPLKLGTDITANCGKVIKKASAVFMWDEQEMGGLPNWARLFSCPKCVNSPVQCAGYVYGLVEGQQAMDQGNSQD